MALKLLGLIPDHQTQQAQLRAKNVSLSACEDAERRDWAADAWTRPL